MPLLIGRERKDPLGIFRSCTATMAFSEIGKETGRIQRRFSLPETGSHQEFAHMSFRGKV